MSEILAQYGTAEQPSPQVSAIRESIAGYNRITEKWLQRCRKIIRRYEDDRDVYTSSRASRYNALWANVSIFQPALYSRLPNITVNRRYLDSDPVGRTVSQILQRCLTFIANEQPLNQALRQSILDYLLVGRAVCWLRYAPDIDGDNVEWESVAIDYVNWHDFGHSAARTWEEVTIIWRRVFMTREQMISRFGEDIGSKVPLNSKALSVVNDSDRTLNTADKKAVVYEVWNKGTKKVTWLCLDYPTLLDERDDPLQLTDFFPVPRPLYATVTNESIIPTPDYVLYQDQAIALDVLCQRISMLEQSLKVAGVYDTACDGVQRIMNEGVENQLIPVDSWALFAEKGGLKGAVDWFPIEMVANVRIALEDAFSRTKLRMDEITGLSDVIKGSTNANETATSQQIKSNYAGLRLRDRQAEVQRFIRDIAAIAGEIVAKHFSQPTLEAMSQVKLFQTEQQKAAAKQAVEMSVQPGTQGGIDSLDEAQINMLESPSWEEVMAVLRDDMQRSFRVDIETDSTIFVDEEEQKKSRNELIASTTAFFTEVYPVVQQSPEIAPIIMQIFMFGLRGYRIGVELEASVEALIASMQKKAVAAIKNPPEPQPPIELQLAQMKTQADAEKLHQEQQFDIQKTQATWQYEQQMEAQKMQAEAQKMQSQAFIDAQIAQATQQLEAQKLELEHELEREKMHTEAQANEYQQMLEAQKIQLQADNDSAQIDAQLRADLIVKQAELDASKELAYIDADTKLQIAEINADAKEDASETVEDD